LDIGGLKTLPSAKSYRASERKRKINAPLRAKARTSVVKARALIDSNDLEGAQKAANDAIVGLDKAAQKGVIHKKNAARRKSRLMKRLQSAKSG
jgi:small subunit ribosomal protein S20